MYVYYLTRAFIGSSHSSNFPTHAFNLATQAFYLATHSSFELVTCRFELGTHKFVLVTFGFELVTDEVELLTRKSELTTHISELASRNSSLVFYFSTVFVSCIFRSYMLYVSVFTACCGYCILCENRLFIERNYVLGSKWRETSVAKCKEDF